MGARLLGQAIASVEDEARLRGEARFTSDVAPPHCAHMELVLSSEPHALVSNIDISRATDMPGVLRVLTGKDLPGTVMPLPCIWVPGGTESHFPPHPYGLPGAGTILAIDRVRYVGEPVVAVVAETRSQARDAADRIEVTYEPLPAVVEAGEALAEGAPQLHAEVPGNLNARWTCGDADATDRAIAEAEVVVELDVCNQRTINSPIEPRACVGDYDPVTGQYVLHATSQSPHNHGFMLSALVLGIPLDKLRVIATNVGGSFGTKGYLYPDMALVLVLAAELQRPVKWVDTRNGLMRSTVQGRDQVQHVTLAGRRDGTLTALRCRSLANLGAYPSTIGPGVATALMGRSITGPYLIPQAFCEVLAVFTNKVPLGAQRGSGRAEATFLMERALDVFARRIGKDRAALRRQNMVPASRMPYDNGLGWTYDSGDYAGALELALRHSGYADLADRRAEVAGRGKLLGVGIASYVAVSGVGPSTRMSQEGMLGGTWESANLRVQPTGEVVVTVGSASTGQSHRTVFAQVAADTLQVPLEVVTVHEADTRQTPFGQGTYGSRSFSVGGPAVRKAAEGALEKMRAFAAHVFEVERDEVRYADGVFSVDGDASKTRSFSDLALALWYGWNLPAGMEPTVDVTTYWDPPDFNYPYGTHVAVVEVQPETGEVEIVRYVAVNDAGVIGNPLVAKGQVEGSIVHGLGQVLMEEARFGADGRLLSDDLRRYSLPRSIDVPPLVLDWTHTASPHNALGAKGVGEIATVPVAAAVANAVGDALSASGVDHIDMPLTPERIWRAVRGAAGTGDRRTAGSAGPGDRGTAGSAGKEADR